MDMLDYAGIVLVPNEVPTAVAMAASGRIPAPRRGAPPTEDPSAWLCGLVERATGTPMESPVVRALGTVLRTGNSRQLQSLAPVALKFPIFDGPLLISTLERRQVTWDRDTVATFAEAVGHWVARGQIAYDDRLRAHLEDRKQRGGLIPAYMVADRAWFLDGLEPLLARNPADHASFVAKGLGYLSEEDAASVRATLARLLPGLSEPVRAALERELPELRAPVEAPPVEVPKLDADALPWRGEDGRWFLVPEDAHVARGNYEIRRGWRVRQVQRRAVSLFEIPADDAERLRAGQLTALWAAGREALARVSGVTAPEEISGALGSSPPALLSDPEAREAAAARVAAARQRLRELLASPEAKRLAERLAGAVKGEDG
jgi:hypothetical protein